MNTKEAKEELLKDEPSVFAVSEVLVRQAEYQEDKITNEFNNKEYTSDVKREVA